MTSGNIVLYLLISLLYLGICLLLGASLAAYLLAGQEEPQFLETLGYVLGFPLYTLLVLYRPENVPEPVYAILAVLSLLLNSGIWAFTVNALLFRSQRFD